MRVLVYFILLSYFAFTPLLLLADPPGNDNITGAKGILTPFNYCSDAGEFTNIAATDSDIGLPLFWQSPGKDVWFKFTAIRSDVLVSINGVISGNGPQLSNPTGALYIYDKITDQLTNINASMTAGFNETTVYKSNLTIGAVYYIRVSAENDATGNFKLCVNNYNPPQKQGQDCGNASFLCNKQTIIESGLNGAGSDNHEAISSCLPVESNSAWYLWKTGKPGSLTFTIIPSVKTDDIDWVLYDLGINGDCSNLKAVNLMRCVIGSGTNCTPSYFITGLSMNSTDLDEGSGCIVGQDGLVKYIDMLPGHNYALLVDNFSNANNGYTLAFGGTAEFSDLKGVIDVAHNNPCLPNQSYTFTNASENYSSLKWSFGEDANIASSSLGGPHTITYATGGLKTVVLEVFGSGGCSDVVTSSFMVTLTPATPIISSDKSSYCILETMLLSTPEVQNATYLWTGPDSFTAATALVNVPISSLNQSGSYNVVITVGVCKSTAGNIIIPEIIKNPISNFMVDPPFPGNYSVPIPIQFTNKSLNTISYQWDFGDGSTSIETDPKHTYTKPGNYTVVLTSFTENGCSNAKSMGNMFIKNSVALFTPNAFSPNGDGVNEVFTINITNLRKYDIQIFNRFGDKVYANADAAISWDGNFKGAQMPVGVYYYKISGIDLFYKPISFTGSVTLIR